MKIIKTGVLPKDKWNGQRVICRYCNTEMEITSSADVKSGEDQRDGAWAYVICPLCHQQVNV